MKVKDLKDGRVYLTRFGTMRLLGYDLYGFAVFECVATGERHSLLAADVIALAAASDLPTRTVTPDQTRG